MAESSSSPDDVFPTVSSVKQTLAIPARNSVSTNYEVFHSGDQLSLQWTVEAHDINVHIAFTPHQDAVAPFVIMQPKRFAANNTPYSYTYTCDQKGTCTITFDNRHSLMRAKTVTVVGVVRHTISMGAQQQTVYGLATVIGRRQHMYTCQLPWARAYLHVSAFQSPASADGADAVLSPRSHSTSTNDRALVGCRLFFCNENELSEAFFQDELTASPVFLISYAVIGHVRALMTFERSDIDDANERLNRTRQICDERLPAESALSSITSSVTSSVTRIISLNKSSPSSLMSPDTLELTLISAESLILQAQLLLTEESVLSLVKAGLKLRSAWQMLDRCEKELAEHTRLNTVDTIDPHVVAGIQFEVGVFNAIISILPPTVLRVLSYMGYPASRSKGFALLNQAVQSNTLRSPLASLALLLLHVVVPSFYSVHMALHLSIAQVILDDCMRRFPNGALFLWMSGRAYRNQRAVEFALKAFTASAQSQPKWKQLQHLCDYEIGWCHMFLLQYTQSLPSWQRLYEENSWSKAFFLYMQAVANIDAHVQTAAVNDISTPKTASLPASSSSSSSSSSVSTSPLMPDNEFYRRIEDACNRKLAGKQLSIEQFILHRTNQWTKTGARPLLPSVEMIYIFNGFIQMSDERLHRLNTVVTAALDNRKSLSDDQIYLLILMRASLLRGLKDYTESIALLESLFPSNEQLAKDERWMIPFARFEYAAAMFESYVASNNIGEPNSSISSPSTRSVAERTAALKPIREAFRASETFSGEYFFRHRLQLRIHLATSELKRIKRGQHELTGEDDTVAVDADEPIDTEASNT